MIQVRYLLCDTLNHKIAIYLLVQIILTASAHIMRL